MKRRIVDIIASPLHRHLALFASMLALMVLLQMVLWPICRVDSLPLVSIGALIVFKLCYGGLQAWALTLIADLLPQGWWRRLYVGVVMTVVGLCTIVDCYFLLFFHYEFNTMCMGIIVGTNFEEISEFVAVMMPRYMWAVVLAVIVLPIAVYLIVRRISCRHKLPRRLALAMPGTMLMVTVALLIVRPGFVPRFGTLWHKVIVSPTEVVSPPDLKHHHREVTYTGREPRPDIVVIIGESVCRDHSSLYGYDKETNPELQRMLDNGELWRFDSVTSAETHTIESLQRVLSTYRGDENGDSRKWYDCYNVMDLLRDGGYYTAWLSNQNKRGIFDNIVTKFALATDYQKWSRERLVSNVGIKGYDDVLIGFVDSVPAHQGKPLACFIHMYGSHYDFNERFPASAARFKETDYHFRRELQRRMYADYDNSLHYSDSIVARLMHRFDGRPTIVVYFPDHGLDFGHTSVYYYCHGKSGDAESVAYASRIPMVVYTTPEYREAYPEGVERIKRLATIPFNTTNTIYLLSELLDLQSPALSREGKVE